MLDKIMQIVPTYEKTFEEMFAKMQKKCEGKLDFEHLWSAISEEFRTEEKK